MKIPLIETKIMPFKNGKKGSKRIGGVMKEEPICKQHPAIADYAIPKRDFNSWKYLGLFFFSGHY